MFTSTICYASFFILAIYISLPFCFSESVSADFLKYCRILKLMVLYLSMPFINNFSYYFDFIHNLYIYIYIYIY